MPQTENAVFYHLYFQTPGVAEAELEHHVPRSIRSLLYSTSGDATRSSHRVDSPGMVPRSGGFLDTLADSEGPLNWLTDADVDFYVQEFVRTGFRGAV
jgi:hypothetical protein